MGEQADVRIIRSYRLGLLAVFLAAYPLFQTRLAAESLASPPSVLVIYSYGSSVPWERKVMEGLRGYLDKLPEKDRPTIFEETLDTSRLGDFSKNTAWGLYLSEKYRSAGVDVVMTESQQAAELLMSLPKIFPAARRYIFHYAPLPSHPPPLEKEKRFSSADDLERAILAVRDAAPLTTKVVAVLDRSVIGRARAAQLESIRRSLPRSLELEIWNDIDEEKLYAASRKLPRNAALFYIPVQIDAKGNPLVPADVARRLSQVASVPVFTHFDTLIGTGVVGGYVVSAGQLGRMMGEAAAYGEADLPSSQPDYAAAIMGYYFDARALRRWRIDESRLPEGSALLFRDRTFLEEYARYIAIVAALFLLETALVLALVSSSIRRKKAMAMLDEERATLESKVILRTAELARANEGLQAEIEERRRAEDKERATIREKEMMLKEFQHRVKNGLGIITSLVSLEAGRMQDEEGSRVLRNLESRISALATLYDMLYAAGAVTEVDADAYLSRLVDNLAKSLGADARGIRIAAAVDPVPIDIKRAISLALVTNELATNAFKYAFPEGRTGTIQVDLAADEGMLRFEVSDDGVGLPAGFDPESSGGLGMTLVTILARQLEASFSFASSAGARFALRFPR